MDEILNKSIAKFDINFIQAKKPGVVLSIIIPLGENGIIQLVDSFRSRDDVTILFTDLYYNIVVNYKGVKISFYSRGLITFEVPSETNKLGILIEQAETLEADIPLLLEELLTKYHLSMVGILGDIDKDLIHISIVIKGFQDPAPDGVDFDREEFLNWLAQQPQILQFIGEPRSIGSRQYEDVIIGTQSSIIRSDDMETLLSYHLYNRSLHLFLTRYNIIIETVWNTLNRCDDLVDKFDEKVRLSTLSSRFRRGGLSERHKHLTATRSQVIRGIKDIDQFLVLTSFIEDSIDFTQDKYVETKNSGNVRENAFHILKVLHILSHRAKHLKVVSKSFITRGRTLLSRVELYASEVAYESQQKMEKIAFFVGLVGLILAIIAIWVEI